MIRHRKTFQTGIQYSFSQCTQTTSDVLNIEFDSVKTINKSSYANEI